MNLARMRFNRWATTAYVQHIESTVLARARLGTATLTRAPIMLETSFLPQGQMSQAGLFVCAKHAIAVAERSLPVVADSQTKAPAARVLLRNSVAYR